MRVLAYLVAIVGIVGGCRCADAQEEKDVGRKAREEIARRGAMVEHVDGTHESADDLRAMAQLPPDDSGKFCITLVTTRGCKYCEQLRYDVRNKPELQAWINAADYKASWSHYAEVQIEDQSQSWRWRDFRPSQFPTIILQPPLNRSYGDPRTVIFLQAGYDGNAAGLSAKLRDALDRYGQKVRLRRSASDGGMGQAKAADWRPPAPAPSPFAPPAPQQLPPLPVAPSVPVNPDVDIIGGLIRSLLPSAPTFWMIIAALSNILIYIQQFRPQPVVSVPAAADRQRRLPGTGEP